MNLKRIAIVLGLAVMLLFGAYSCVSSVLGRGSADDDLSLSNGPTPTPFAIPIPRSLANYEGYPLGRPSWCTVGTWGMASMANPKQSGRTMNVPVCTEPGGVYTLLGSWPREGCTPLKPATGVTRPNAVIIAPNGKPDMRFYTICGRGL